ncbi:hypothetical protein LOC57_11930 [Arthrobacter sp. zg-Y750]|nr:hypothetical protein [Arthrobacter sp. zg-Y750]
MMVCALSVVSGGLAGCGIGAQGLEDAPAGSADKTSRESYDQFVAQMDEILAVTGATTGWTSEYGYAWPPEPDKALIPRPCDSENWKDSPRQITLQLLGPGTEDFEADRDAMIRYMEGRGMEISGVLGDSSYPEGVAWNAVGQGANGLTIDYATSPSHRAVTLYGECSSHPSMQEGVSRTAP